MKFMSYLSIATLSGGFFLMPVLAQTGAPHVASGHRETLLQTTQSWNGRRYVHYPSGQPQLTTIKVTLAPHTALPWHTHPFPNSVYVLSGTLTLRDRYDGKTLLVHQGQAWVSLSTLSIAASRAMSPPSF
jgi:quercetin dioxygenase-like cupin family protein